MERATAQEAILVYGFLHGRRQRTRKIPTILFLENNHIAVMTINIPAHAAPFPVSVSTVHRM